MRVTCCNGKNERELKILIYNTVTDQRRVWQSGEDYLRVPVTICLL